MIENCMYEPPITIESLFGTLPTPSHYTSFECAQCFAERDNDLSMKHDCSKCPHCPYPSTCLDNKKRYKNEK